MSRILKSGVGSAAVHAALFGGFLLLGFGAEKPPITIDLTIMPAETMEPEADKEAPAGAPASAPAPPSPVAARPQPRPRARRPEKAAAPEIPTAKATESAADETSAPKEVPPHPSPAAPESPHEGPAGSGPAVAGKGASAGAVVSANTTSGPGVGQGGVTAHQAYLARHFAYIRDAIQRSASYPPLARRMGWVGRVIIAFRILADGSVSSVRVSKGSGIPVLDSSAIEAVRRASPFPPPPAEAEIVAPVAYALE